MGDSRQEDGLLTGSVDPAIILATGSSAFLASLLLNMAVRSVQQISITTAVPTTSAVSATTSTTTPIPASSPPPVSNIPATGCPDGWEDGRGVGMGCVWAEIYEDPLLTGVGDTSGYSLGGGENVKQVELYISRYYHNVCRYHQI